MIPTASPYPLAAIQRISQAKILARGVPMASESATPRSQRSQAVGFVRSCLAEENDRPALRAEPMSEFALQSCCCLKPFPKMMSHRCDLLNGEPLLVNTADGRNPAPRKPGHSTFQFFKTYEERTLPPVPTPVQGPSSLASSFYPQSFLLSDS